MPFCANSFLHKAVARLRLAFSHRSGLLSCPLNSPQHHGSPMALPVEILGEILVLLDAVQIAACRLVCRSFNHMIRQNARLQYHIQLAVANCVDGSDQNPLCVGERLQLLRTRQTAWKAQDFRVKRRFVTSSVCGLLAAASAYRSGVLVFGVMNPALNPDADPLFIQRFNSIYVNELYVVSLRGSTEELVYRRHRLQDACYSDFELEPSQDLLILWDCFEDFQDNLPLRFLSLRNGTPHRRARFYNLRIPITTFFPSIQGPSITYAFDDCSVQPRGEFVTLSAIDSENVLLLNWLTGEQWVIGGSSGCLLRNDCLFVVNDKASPPFIDVFDISDCADHALPPPRRFQLPRLNSGISCSIDCRASASSARSDAPEHPAHPFTTTQASAMVALSFGMRRQDVGIEAEGQYSLLSYCAPFFAALKRPVPSSDMKPGNFEITPWEDWGADSTFWLGNVENIDNVWSYAFYGYRVMLPELIYDFNPRNIQTSSTAGKSDGDLAKAHTGTYFVDEPHWFAQEIRTNRAYLLSNVNPSKVPASFSCFLLDEDILALEDASDTAAEEAVFTLLSVGPD